MNLNLLRKLVFTALLLATAVHADEFDPKRLGLTPEKQHVQYWINQAAKDQRVAIHAILLNADEIENLNRKLRETEPTFTDIFALPEQISAEQVQARIARISKRPTQQLMDDSGSALSKRRLDKLIKNVNLRALPANQKVEFGLVTVRSALRTFPTNLRVFNQRDNTDIDRFQESALFPGTPVVVLHESKDRQWLFVLTDLYSAWIRKNAVALATRSEVADYASSKPRLVITDAKARTAYTPDRTELSDLALDMGISLPWLNQWPVNKAVNGQGPLGSRVIALPVRGRNGRMSVMPALLPNHFESSDNYLSLSKMQLLLQSFQFIGERYGWGHDYGTRDCSGFVSEIYRSMGVVLPRNTSDQARSTAFNREPFNELLSREQRITRVSQLNIGDLVYIPGHVMMVVGHDQYGPWVIHDSHGTGFLQNSRFYPVATNGVAITPLLSMALNAEKTYIDAITSVQHIIPKNRFQPNP